MDPHSVECTPTEGVSYHWRYFKTITLIKSANLITITKNYGLGRGAAWQITTHFSIPQMLGGNSVAEMTQPNIGLEPTYHQIFWLDSGFLYAW